MRFCHILARVFLSIILIGTAAAATAAPLEPAVSPGENPCKIVTNNQSLEILCEERSALKYLYAGVPFKPCVAEFRTPSGVNVLRDAPHDHLHHHALMYAIAVDGVNFWEEHGAAIGREKHRALRNVEVAPDARGIANVSFAESLDWIGADKETGAMKLFLRENRALTLARAKPPMTSLLTWRSDFSLPPGKESATLSGAHYFGLGMRFVESMDKAGEFRFAEGAKGETVRGSEQNTTADWCAYTASVEGKPVTVAMFGHPSNRRGQTMWFSMTQPFAYISATLGLHQKPMELRREEGTMSLVYGAALWDGRVETERIEALYRKWVEVRLVASLPPLDQ